MSAVYQLEVAYLSAEEPPPARTRLLRELVEAVDVIRLPEKLDRVVSVLGTRSIDLILLEESTGRTATELYVARLAEEMSSSAICVLLESLDERGNAPVNRLLEAGALEVIAPGDLQSEATVRRLAARALGFSERISAFARFRKMVDHTQDVITLLDQDGKIRFESPSVREVLGYDPDELLGRDPFELIHEEDRPKVVSAYLEERESPGARRSAEYRFKHADGHWITLESRAKVVRYADGSAGLIVSSRDVSEQRRALDALKRREQQLADAQRLTHIGSWQWKPGTNELSWSDEMYRIYGYEPGSPLSFERFLEGVHPDDRDTVRDTVAESLESPGSFEFIHRIVRPDGEIRRLEGRGVVVADEDGEVEELYGTGRDITELYDSRRRLEQSERRFRRLFESSPDPILVIESDGSIQNANPAAADLLALKLESLPGYDLRNLLPEDLSPSELDVIESVISGETRSAMTRALTQDGHSIPIHMHANTITLEDAQRVLVYVRDVSEQVRTEKQLRRLGRRQEEILERERERISREVHDVLGQALTALRMDASWVRSHLDHDDVRDRLDAMGERINDTIESVRRIAYDLRPGMLDDFGLAAAIEWHAEKTASNAHLRTRVGALDNPDLPGDLATAIFRIYQELITNVVRHAHADTVDISLTAPGDNLVLSVKDDGVGMEVGHVRESGSLGLLGIRERLSIWGGRLELESTPGVGTRADVIVPIPSDQSETAI